MYVQGEYIQPGEQVLFILKKNDSHFLAIGMFFLIGGIPLGLVALVIREELVIRMLLGFPFVSAFILTILAIRQYKKTKLVLTNCRLLLSQGLFTIKSFNIPIGEIEAIMIRSNGGEIIFPKGTRIPLSSIFDKLSIEKLVKEFNFANNRSALPDDIKAQRDEKPTEQLPGSSGIGETQPKVAEDVLNAPEEIIFTWRESKSRILIETAILIFLISFDFIASLKAFPDVFFKLLSMSMWGFVIIVCLYLQLRRFKDIIILTGKDLIIRGNIADPVTKYVSLKAIPLASIHKVFYLDYLFVVFINGEQLTVKVRAKPRDCRLLVDHIAELNKRFRGTPSIK